MKTNSCEAATNSKRHKWFESKKTMVQAKVAMAVSAISIAIFSVAVAIGALSGLFVFAGIVAFTSFSILYGSSSFSHYKNVCQTAGIVLNQDQIKELKLGSNTGTCEAIPTKNCADTVEWRKALIRAAEENIVVSGNYCGQTAFTEFLEEIEMQMDKKPHLKVVLLSSPIFLTKGNLANLDHLSKKFHDRFSIVKSPDIWHVSPGIKKSTNHTKCMVVDYGKYFILGGNGIKDDFSEIGLEDQSKAAFLMEREKEFGSFDIKQKTQKTHVKTQGSSGLFAKFARKLTPKSFRDMDFVFHSHDDQNPSGAHVYKQMLLLCHRWEQYNKVTSGDQSASTETAENFGVFTDSQTPIANTDSLTTRLLKSPIPSWEKITTRVPQFDSCKAKAQDVAFKVFASGPECNKSSFTAELLHEIENAEKRIVINHMYFHPTKKILAALAAAAERGVEIKIITASTHKNCPTTHFFFAPRNKTNFIALLKLISPENRQNVQIHEFRQEGIGIHKKLIVIDDTVIAGSSNLGYKSLVSTSDHELNFSAISHDFAETTLEICEEDIRHSKKFEGRLKASLSERIVSFHHRLLAPLIG